MNERDFIKEINEAIDMYKNGEILEASDLLHEIADSIKEVDVD
jgi:hypothetical protein